MTMKTFFVLPLLLACASPIQAGPSQELKVPLRWGVYLADVRSGRVRSLGNFYEWSLSPDGRFCVGGRDSGRAYEVDVVSIPGGATRVLEKFPLDETGTNAGTFEWSPDSSRVSVEADRNDDGHGETKTFRVSRPGSATTPKARHRELSDKAMRRLKARFSSVSEVVFSPDGSRVVAYLSRDKPGFADGLWMFAPDGTGLRRLTRTAPLSRRDLETGNPPQSRNLQDREPRWLPDGQHLAFRRGNLEEET
jgi:Tol biopolymer transport system component